MKNDKFDTVSHLSSLHDDTDDKSNYTAFTGRNSKTSRAQTKKKYQVRVEIRCSNEEIMDLMRTDIESLIVDDLS